MADRIKNIPVEGTQEIFEKFQVIEPTSLRRFLLKNSYLKDQVLEAEKAVNRYFQNPNLFLQVVTDKEDPADSRVVISIDPAEPPKEAFDKLKQLRQAWWFDASEASQDKLAITLRYR